MPTFSIQIILRRESEGATGRHLQRYPGYGLQHFESVRGAEEKSPGWSDLSRTGLQYIIQFPPVRQRARITKWYQLGEIGTFLLERSSGVRGVQILFVVQIEAASMFEIFSAGWSAGTDICEMTALLAYLDPGAGSMVLQVLIAGILGMSLAIRTWWHAIMSFVFRKKNTPETPVASDNASSNRPSSSLKQAA